MTEPIKTLSGDLAEKLEWMHHESWRGPEEQTTLGMAAYWLKKHSESAEQPSIGPTAVQELEDKMKSCEVLIDHVAELLGVKNQEHKALYGWEILKAIKELKNPWKKDEV